MSDLAFPVELVIETQLRLPALKISCIISHSHLVHVGETAYVSQEKALGGDFGRTDINPYIKLK